MTPAGHLRGTRALLDAIEQVAGPHPSVGEVRALLDPGNLPAELGPRESAFKYDAYLACTEPPSFGVTVNDRWDPGLEARVGELAARWGYDLAGFVRLRTELPTASLCAAFGFAAKVVPAKLKLYLQEDRWNEGVCTVATLARLLPELAPRLALPAWLEPERTVGVVTWTLSNDGASLKLYLGAETALEAARGAPEEACALARDIARASPLAPAWHYLTVRVEADRPHRYAINKIYNSVGILNRRARDKAEAAWNDVVGLFALAGHADALASLRERLAASGVPWVLPTATALEDGSRSADVYVGAWFD